MTRQASYARAFDRAGRRATLQRRVANGTPPVVSVENVRVRLWGASSEEIAGGMKSTERHILVLAVDVPSSFRPLQQGDSVVIDGLSLMFTQRPDDQTRRDGDLLLAYEGVVSGR